MQDRASLAFISKRFRDIRVAVGLTQMEVQAETGIPQSNLSAYECGTKMPPASACKALAKCYKCSADLLLGIRDSGMVRNVGKIDFSGGVGR